MLRSVFVFDGFIGARGRGGEDEKVILKIIILYRIIIFELGWGYGFFR